VFIICDTSELFGGQLKETFWAVLHDGNADRRRRFRSAIALSKFDARGPAESWQSAAPFVVRELVNAVERDPGAWSTLVGALATARDRLRDPLIELVMDSSMPESRRLTATRILAEYDADNTLLVELILSIDSRQHQILLDKLAARRLLSIDRLRDVFDQIPPPESRPGEKSLHTERQAVAAITLG
jgi:hypothetical protein